MASKRRQGRPAKQPLSASEMLILELQEIHSAESQLTRVIPRIAKRVESERLGQMIDERLAEGETILQDVEAALEELDATPGRRKNVAAEGLINDAREHVQEIETGPALDAVLISALQKTEHYCIAAWGTVRALAESAGLKDAARAMERALKVGKKYDEQLTQLAEKEVTPALFALEEDEELAASNGARSRKSSGSERRATN